MEISLKIIVYLTVVFASEFTNDKEYGKALLIETIDKMHMLCMKEVKFNPKSVTKRQFVFSWNQLVLQSRQFVQSCSKLDEGTLHKLLFPVVRELVSKANSSDVNAEFCENSQQTYQSFEKAFKHIEKPEKGESKFLSLHYSKIVSQLRERNWKEMLP